MFSVIVFIFLLALLFLAGGAALHMGLFKAHKKDTSFTRKALGGVVSYGLSGVFWFFCYSHYYMGW